MDPQARDIAILRDLATQVMATAAHPKYAERRQLWTEHNSLKRTRPLVVVACGRYAAYEYELIKHECADRLFRDIEFQLRHKLFQDWVDDDSVVHPWVQVSAVFSDPGWGVWAKNVRSDLGVEGAYKLAAEPALTPSDSIGQVMRKPRHTIDVANTQARLERVVGAIGDIMPVHDDRTTPYIAFGADISYALGQLLGIERLMMHMYDDPVWLHELLAFLRDGILSVQAEAEQAGDFTAVSQHNQVEAYARETVEPVANGGAVTRQRLWGFFAAQEFATISPAMHEEFLFRYQLPIMETAGLVAYGCCEDLTRKMGMLRQLKNLRRVAVTPWADVAECARQIQDKYVLSWRPNPASMVCSGFDPEWVEAELRQGLAASAGCHIDILLKDIQTVQGDPSRLKRWARLAKDLVADFEQ